MGDFFRSTFTQRVTCVVLGLESPDSRQRVKVSTYRRSGETRVERTLPLYLSLALFAQSSSLGLCRAQRAIRPHSIRIPGTPSAPTC